MTRYWIIARDKVGALSLRERAIVFATVALVVVSLVSEVLLAPLHAKRKVLSDQVVQQQERTKELQAQLQSLLQAQRDEGHSPLRVRVESLRRNLQEQAEYLEERREHLVAPDRMANVLAQVLHENRRVQLVELKTLPVGLLMDKPQEAGAVQPVAVDGQRQIFRHGVQITVRGSYLDLLGYASALEKLPTRMYWGDASLSVEHYPDAVLTFTVYTLSLDQTWLTI
ncbi:MAG: agglutinin biogenesis protein [Gallionella sp.]|jgi:MSHA biogenesis protein MshJ|nr:agglutinin biogenesis protein [Gallionella sp.]MCK9354268.1 agglutinin biogenesis protein [Gallionella sp.]